MDEQRRGAILADCIERLQAGETVADCLTHCGDEAAAVAPLLTVAARLQQVGAHRLTDGQRGQAKATLRAATLSQSRRATHPEKRSSWRLWLAPQGRMRGLALASMLAVTLFVVVTITAVAASQPGDVAYPVRVIVERAPVLLKLTAADKATMELRIADRRLADLASHLATKGEIEPAAVEALLAGDQAAAARADELPQAERVQAASRVAAHAAALAMLAQSAPQPSAEVALQAAAARAESLSQRLERGGTESDGAPSTPDARPTETPSAPVIVVPPASVTPTPEPQASEAPTATPSPTNRQPTRSSEVPSATPIPGWHATASAQTATAAVLAPTGTPVPGRRATALAQTATVSAPVTTDTPEPSPVHTSTRGPDTPAPGRRATALAQTATAPAVATDTPEPSPVHTSTRGPDTPVPGRRATALAQTATAPAPVATDTPEPSPAHTPAGGPDTPVPGRRATALAQTATPAAADTPGPSAPETPVAP